MVANYLNVLSEHIPKRIINATSSRENVGAHFKELPF